ncbi:MAG: hypothetical protein KF716_07120 [Anaerolineae bacterium]|nr:hypothetical protein [Anaerolineae bacterium]
MIQFNIPGAELHVITLFSQLPAITEAVTIDGYTQPLAIPATSTTAATLLIELNGANAGDDSSGLLIRASNVRIRGLVINRFRRNGIDLDSVLETRIEGNYLGVDPSGSRSDGNLTGISLLNSSNTIIGGNIPAARNVIAGHATGYGIYIKDGSSNHIAGNYIGVDATGTYGLVNRTGILLYGSHNNLIGTDADGINDEGERNIISGNIDPARYTFGQGVFISGDEHGNATNNRVMGNYIGTNVDGTKAIRNDIGIDLLNCDDTIIGTNGDGVGDAVEGNLVSGNEGVLFENDYKPGFGIRLDNHGGLSQNLRIAGNLIGVDKSGNEAIPNTFGISLKEGKGHIIGTNGDGQSDVLERNIISGNWIENVLGMGIVAGSTTDVRIAGNLIGVDATGTHAIPNGDGISLGSNQNMLIGTNSDGISDVLERNVIAGNATSTESAHGIVYYYYSSTFFPSTLHIAGNYIGVDITGLKALPNNVGIEVQGDRNITIGADGDGIRDEVERNIIAGNSTGAGIGIRVNGIFAPNGLSVIGNYVGVGADGLTALGNKQGLVLYLYSWDNAVIRNIFANNVEEGILVYGTQAYGNDIRSNSIYNNGGSGITLANGGNNNQPAPTLTQATSTGAITGTFSGTAGKDYRVQYFANKVCDPSGVGEGEVYLGEQVVHVQTDGEVPISFRTHLQAGQYITATLTDPVNGTSTFSTCIAVTLISDTIGIFRPSAATFYLRNSNTTGFADSSLTFGAAIDFPIAGDWNGDGIDTPGVYRRTTGQFFLTDSTTNPATMHYAFVLGNPNDQPIVGDWDGDGKDGVGVFRPSNGLIYLKNNLTTGFADFTMVLGIPGDVGLAGDWDGDGKDSPGVYRPSTQVFYLSNTICNCSVFADAQLGLGAAGDIPFAGDWDGDGKTGVGVYRQTNQNGLIYLKNALTTGFADVSLVFGGSGDYPLAGYWVRVGSPAVEAASTFVPTR